MSPLVLAPSILAGNHANLAESVAVVERAGLQWLHLDIMDGHFVPNLSFGPQTVRDLRSNSKLYFDTHLMLDNPDHYIEAFAKAGADSITVHIEPDYKVDAVLKEIKQLGCRTGIALNPNTAVESVLPHIDQVDLVLIMTVQPGFGGQAFREDTLEKIRRCAQWRRDNNFHFRIEVDGGIDSHTGALCRVQGADTFVSGTAFFAAADQQQFIQSLTQELSMA